MAGEEVYIPNIIRGLAGISISSDGIIDWEGVDLDNVSDILVPPKFCHLPSWWPELAYSLDVYPITSADIEAALSSYISEQAQVCQCH